MNTDKTSLENESQPSCLGAVSGSLQLSKDQEIALYERFLDEFTDKDGLMKPCNPDAIFNWFGWKLWRSKQ